MMLISEEEVRKRNMELGAPAEGSFGEEHDDPAMMVVRSGQPKVNSMSINPMSVGTMGNGMDPQANQFQEQFPSSSGRNKNHLRRSGSLGRDLGEDVYRGQGNGSTNGTRGTMGTRAVGQTEGLLVDLGSDDEELLS